MTKHATRTRQEAFTEAYSGLASRWPNRRVVEAAGIGCVDGLFAMALQHCHDFALSPEDMKLRLKALAKAYGLTIPEVE